MGKRERENPCPICCHYHKYEEGEVCNVCGHRMAAAAEVGAQQESAFPTEILKDALYLGSYGNASRCELLKTIGISHILNTVPSSQNLYRNSFTYYALQDERSLQFDDAIRFLEQCERDKVRVLVHCMSGKNRSAAVVIAYLMKSKGWRLAQSIQWVKDRRPQVTLTDAVYQQLVEFEHKIFSGTSTSGQASPALVFGFPKPPTDVAAPIFTHQPEASVFERAGLSSVGFGGFTFGAGMPAEPKLPDGVVRQAGKDAMMDGM